eukprot:108014-Amphidinium_carterae.1
MITTHLSSALKRSASSVGRGRPTTGVLPTIRFRLASGSTLSTSGLQDVWTSGTASPDPWLPATSLRVSEESKGRGAPPNPSTAPAKP